MQRTLVLAACTLIIATLLPGVRSAEAQATPPELPEVESRDTIPISLSEAQRRALAQNPAFLAERQQMGIARGELTQARVYNFNPELEFQAPGAGTAGALGEYEASLTQEIEWTGARGLRIRAARFGLDRANSGVRDAARQTLADVSTAFYAALAADQRLLVVRELSALNEQLITATRTQAREGEISVMDANFAEIEAGRARAFVLAAEREATSARLELQRLAGIDPEEEIRLQDVIPDAPSATGLDQDSLVAVALARRPDLEARTRAVDQFEALTRLARREAIPNVRIGVFAEREEVFALATGPGGGVGGRTVLESPRIGLGVSVPLPVFDRNQGVVAQRAAQTNQALFSRHATELAVRTQVTDALRAYQNASEEARVFEQDVLQPARANQQLLETAFRAGKVNLPTLLLLRNQLLDAELGYWGAWLAQRRALVELQATTAALESEETLNLTGDR